MDRGLHDVTLHPSLSHPCASVCQPPMTWENADFAVVYTNGSTLISVRTFSRAPEGVRGSFQPPRAIRTPHGTSGTGRAQKGLSVAR